MVAGEARNLAQRSTKAAREILAVRGAAAIMQDITLDSREQGQSIAAVNNALAELDAIRRQNAALVQRSAGASNSLVQDAASLAQAGSVVKLPGARSSAARRTSPQSLQFLAKPHTDHEPGIVT